jgi:hypothetical protein
MIELLALVCTGAMACKDVSYTYDATQLSIMACMMGAQAELAKWTNEHPGWQVTKWSCGVVGRYARA